MTYRLMKESDIKTAVKIYIDYYNVKEGSEWTEATAGKRIHQVWSREDSYCLAQEENGEMLGFAMGYFEQYDDGFAYDLVEIVIAAEHQRKGLGTALMRELEERVKKEGALLIQLDAVADEFHDYFYGRLGYGNASNFVMKCKMLCD